MIAGSGRLGWLALLFSISGGAGRGNPDCGNAMTPDAGRPRYCTRTPTDCPYTVAFALGKKLDGHFRRIQVKPDDGGYALRYRRGDYADPNDKPSGRSLGSTSLTDGAVL